MLTTLNRETKIGKKCHEKKYEIFQHRIVQLKSKFKNAFKNLSARLEDEKTRQITKQTFSSSKIMKFKNELTLVQDKK